MSFTDKKLEIAIVGFAIVMVGGMSYLLKSPVQNVMKELEVVYEMPRPKSILAALFDLGDREISRDYKNPFEKKKAEVKKAEAQAAAQKPAAAKTAAKAKANSKAPTEIKKPSVEVNVVGADETRANLGEDITVGDGNGNNQIAEDTSGNNKQAEPTKSALSGDQWRALLQAQPTKENVAKLIAAYETKEVDDQTFYTIVTDLLRGNKSETQLLGLLALKGAYNAKSFAVAAQYHDSLAPEVQTQVQSYMMTYAASGRLPYLMSALQTNSPEVVTAATQVVMQGYAAAKTGTNLSDPRGSRGDVVANSVESYSKFVPIFQQLAQSQDSEIAGLASAALSQIQTAAVASL
ncbi:hypothetical protein ACES2I_15530 [Bdellovibrio bacteriovorus]|uniref:hypothetical protein n=1 Tax=Bdellovibrio bacteriovorus TaxID=959 RepID=UPI0035A6E07D